MTCIWLGYPKFVSSVMGNVCDNGLDCKEIRQTYIHEICGLYQNGVEHPDLQMLCDLFPQVSYAGQSTEIPRGFQPELLLPGTWRLFSSAQVTL